MSKEGPIKNNNSELLSQYKEQLLNSYNGHLLKLKNYSEQIINSQLNQHLLSEIEKVKTEYEEKQRILVEEFEKEIQNIQERKMKEGDPNGLLASEEQFAKSGFERKIRTSEKALGGIIEMFESKLK